MAFCAKCGTSLSDGAGFCNNCGAQTGGATPPPPYSGPGSQAAPVSSNVIGALAYLAGFVTGIIFLLVPPFNKDPFVRFHAFQSIFLSIAYFLVSIVLGTVFGLTFIVSMWLIMMYKAYNNERYELPIIGPMAASKV